MLSCLAKSVASFLFVPCVNILVSCVPATIAALNLHAEPQSSRITKPAIDHKTSVSPCTGAFLPYACMYDTASEGHDPP
jgi:hypothetical protein